MNMEKRSTATTARGVHRAFVFEQADNPTLPRFPGLLHGEVILRKYPSWKICRVS